MNSLSVRRYKMTSIKIALWAIFVFFCFMVSPVAHSAPKLPISYWQNTVNQHPELAEPKIMLSWHYLQQAKNTGQSAPLQLSCQQLLQGLKLQPSRNALKLAVRLTNYQHNFTLSAKLAEHYLSKWPYDSQVRLWQLQGAIVQKLDKRIHHFASKLAKLPQDLHTILAKADMATYNKDYDSRRNWLTQALTQVKNKQTQAWIWLQLALIDIDWQQNLTLADSKLTQAEQLDPNNPDIQRHRIEWLVLNRQYPQATTQLDQLQSWHQHPELSQLSAMINKKANATIHLINVGKICHQPLTQFIARINAQENNKQIKKSSF